nr:MAG TPA: hypothetical protein [Caudoviricetes sp.]
MYCQCKIKKGSHKATLPCRLVSTSVPDRNPRPIMYD